MVRRSGDLDPSRKYPADCLQLLYQLLSVPAPVPHAVRGIPQGKETTVPFPYTHGAVLAQKRPVDSLRFKSIVDRYAAREKERPHHIRLKTHALLVGERRDDERTRRRTPAFLNA